MINDKIKNVHKITICSDKTKQASIDGVWKWEISRVEAEKVKVKNDKGEEIEEIRKNEIMQESKSDKKIWIDLTTLQEVPKDTPNAEQVNDWVKVCDVEFKIHAKTGITQNDIDMQLQTAHVDFGNGISSPMSINGKLCTVIVLEDGEDIDDPTFEKIAKDCVKPI